MPELPDLENLRRYTEATSLHQRIEAVEVPSPEILWNVELEAFRDAVVGRSLTEPIRHGKNLFVRLSDDCFIVFHFGMSGELVYRKEPAEMEKYTRLRLRFDTPASLFYVSWRKLGSVAYTQDRDAYLHEHRIGSDALSDHWTPETFAQMFAKRKTAAKNVLMDQKTIAGVGNLYSDEIFFQAGIDPERRANELTDEQAQRLHQATRSVLETAIERKGNPHEMPEDWLITHREAGNPCPRCGGTIEKRKLSGRGYLLCPSCQK
jgi:formamidopyrimidine-DNA glycosylase